MPPPKQHNNVYVHRFPVSMLPMMIASLVEAKVSLARIEKFMNLPDIIQDDVEDNQCEMGLF